MAQNLKITQLTEVIAPASTDVLPIVNSSTTKKVQVTNLIKGYTLITAASASTSPADTTTYYCGGVAGFGLSVTEGGSFLMYVPKAGTIKAVYLYITVSGALATSETSTISLRLNNTTDTVISAAIAPTATSQVYSNTALSIAVVQGDYFEYKWVTPNWATNPVNVKVGSVVYIE